MPNNLPPAEHFSISNDPPREANPGVLDDRDLRAVHAFAATCEDRGRSGLAYIMQDRKGGLVGDMPPVAYHAVGDAGTLLLGGIEWLVRFILKCGDLKVCQLEDGTCLSCEDFVRYMFEARLLALRRKQDEAGIDPDGMEDSVA